MRDRHLLSGIEVDIEREGRIGAVAHFDGVAAGTNPELGKRRAFPLGIAVNKNVTVRRDVKREYARRTGLRLSLHSIANHYAGSKETHDAHDTHRKKTAGDD